MLEYTLKNWEQLENLAKQVDIKIDVDNPRKSRLDVAMAYHEKGMDLRAVEAMKGEPSNMDDTVVLMTGFDHIKLNPKTFYESFPRVDKPIENL